MLVAQAENNSSTDTLVRQAGKQSDPDSGKGDIMKTAVQKEQKERLHPIKRQVLISSLWLIKARWVVVGVTVTIGLIAPFIGYNISLPAILSLAFYLLVTNCIFTLVGLRLNTPEVSGRALRVFNDSQIIADWLAIIVLVYFTGGLTSPFIFFFFFHLIMAAVLTPVANFYFNASVVVVLLNAVFLAEYFGLLPHQTLLENSTPAYIWQPPYMIAFLGSLTLSIFLTVYASSWVSGLWRRRVSELFDIKSRLEDSQKERSRFYRLVTHELRAPLAAARTMLVVIADGYVTQPDKQKALVEKVGRRLDAMIEVLNDLLLLAQSRDTMAKADLEEVDLKTLVNNSVEFYRPQANTKEIALSLTTGENLPSLLATRAGLDYICSNLISNAIKYTVKGGQVAIDLKSNDGQMVQLVVSDTGIGIPQESRDKLFTEFYRAPNAKKLGETGTGLGLTITKKLVEEFGGQIVFESAEGKGTTFTITLPIRKAPDNPPAEL
jgi:signal transduction histidine kinase